MEIKHDRLLELGFLQTRDRPNQYRYKMVAGRLLPEAGFYFFEGFTPGIGRLDDLKYLMMLIDYNEQGILISYPGHDN